MHKVAITAVVLMLGGCRSERPASDAGDSGGVSTAATGESAATAADGTVGNGGSAGGDAGTAADTGSAGDADTAGGSDGSGGSLDDPSNPLDCGGKIYACGDGEDNDGDGLVDLNDKECTGPCDNDEASFQTGIPGDNVDCKQDCFFDGNSGSGNDGCSWDLKCDPENPGAEIGCGYTDGNNCSNAAPSDKCVDVCGSMTPPGCDCFGCCRVDTGDGSSVDIFLNSGPDCSLSNLDACNTCTYQADSCGNECTPEGCELCFGQDESDLPPECGGVNACDYGESCEGSSDCADGWYCLSGCCYPPPS